MVVEQQARRLSFPVQARQRAAVTLWEGTEQPDEARIRARLAADGYQAVGWQSEAAAGYGPHAHIYPETIWLLAGSLTVILPAEDRLLELGPGDRVALPQGLLHGTIAGPDGARYLLATR